MTDKKINVFSEIGKLKSVLVHRPGDELENLTPDLLERLLFDDIAYKKVAVEEHDKFTKIMKDNGVEVLYIEELVAQALDNNPDIRNRFIEKFIQEGKVKKEYFDKLFEYLSKMKNLEMVNKMIAGVKKCEMNISDNDKYPFVVDPLPNVLFQRDPFASVGNGITMHNMWSETRKRETMFPDFVFKNHPRFHGDVPRFFKRTDVPHLEGGDVLILNNETLIIGVSQRTQMEAVEIIAKNMWELGQHKKIIALDLPKTRSFMHLDTVFSNIDYDKFIAHPLIFDEIGKFKIFEFTKEGKKELKKSLLEVLEEVVGKKVQIIKCGGDDVIASGREQWNDGTNVLTIAPGKVIAYERNWVTIDLLKKAGVTVITTPSSELSRGRGGPRCMTMPLWREDLK